MEFDLSPLVDFPAVLELGIHKKTMTEFEAWVTTQFPNPEPRVRLLKHFQKLTIKIQEFKIPFDVWIDGSFLTTKPQPLDIDLLILAKKRDVNKLSLDQQDRFYSFFSNENKHNIKMLYSCDMSYIIKGQKRDYDFWYSWFSKSRQGQPKGFISIEF